MRRITTDGLLFEVDARSGFGTLSMRDRRGYSAGTAENAVADVVWGSGKGRINLDGADEFILFGDILDLGTSDFTLEAWVQRAGTGAFDQICSKGSGNASWFFAITDTNVLRCAIRATADATADSVGTLSTGLHHIAASADRGGLMRLYIDGAADGTQDISGQSGSLDNADTFELSRSRGGAGYFGGALLRFRLYGRALAAAEIERNYVAERRLIR